MSTTETIKVTIDEQGNPTIKVEGVRGKSCKKLTEALERKLGSVSSSVPTPEMQQEAAHARKVEQR